MKDMNDTPIVEAGSVQNVGFFTNKAFRVPALKFEITLAFRQLEKTNLHDREKWEHSLNQKIDDYNAIKRDSDPSVEELKAEALRKTEGKRAYRQDGETSFRRF